MVLAGVAVVAVVGVGGDGVTDEPLRPCQRTTLERDLGRIDGTTYEVDAQACEGRYAYVHLQRSGDPDGPRTYVAARLGGDGWEAIHRGAVDDCIAEVAPVDPAFPVALCGLTG